MPMVPKYKKYCAANMPRMFRDCIMRDMIEKEGRKCNSVT